MRRRRRLVAFGSAVCAFILLPISTNVATDGPLPDFIVRNRWLPWTALVIFGLITVIALVELPSGASPKSKETVEPEPQTRPHVVEEEPEIPEEAGRTAPLNATPVQFGRHPERFRGRRSLLGKLQRGLETGGLVVLVGSGGTGKSTLARELVRKHWLRDGADDQRPAWEVPAATLQELVDRLGVLAWASGARVEEVAAIQAAVPDGPDHLWAVLESSEQRWVLIVDNADDTTFLGRPTTHNSESAPTLADGTGWVRAGQRGMVIVTSRQREKRFWPPSAQIFPIGLLSPNEAAQVLCDLAKNAGTRTQAKALAQRLGRLPLALHLAGLYLGSGYAVPHDTFDAYRQALESDPTMIRLIELAPNDPEAAERMTIMVTWELSLDALARHGIPQARPLLRLLSCFAPNIPVPLSLLRPDTVADYLAAAMDLSGWAATAPLRVDTVLKGLHQLGLIDQAGGVHDRGLMVHPVVADTNRIYLLEPRPGDPPESLVRQTAVKLLVAALDDLADERPSTWSAFRVLTPHLQALLSNSAARLAAADLETLIRVTADTAVAYANMKSAEFGIELITSALRHGRKHGLEASHAATIAEQYLARLFGQVGRHAEAVEIFNKILDRQLREWRADDPANLVARHNRAMAWAEMGAHEEAMSELQGILADEQDTLGGDHFVTLQTRMDYATILYRRGRVGEAEASLRAVVADAGRVLGTDDNFTLVARHNLTQMLWRGDRQAEAEAAMASLEKDLHKTLGDDHVITATTAHRGEGDFLSFYRVSKSDLHDDFAEFLYRKAVDGMSAGSDGHALETFDDLIDRFAGDTSPKAHAIVGHARFYSAFLRYKSKQLEAALKGFEQVAEVHANDASAELRVVRSKAMFYKAVVLGELGHAEKRAAAYDDLIEAFQDERDSRINAVVAGALFNQAVHSREDPRPARAFIERAVQRYRELAGEDPQTFGPELESAQRLRDQIDGRAAA